MARKLVHSAAAAAIILGLSTFGGAAFAGIAPAPSVIEAPAVTQAHARVCRIITVKRYRPFRPHRPYFVKIRRCRIV
jgi:hypothetical protein